MTGFDDFDRIALDEKYAADDGGFQALFEQAFTRMRKDHPHGFPATAAGHAAWDQLTAEQKVPALDSLLYAHFCDSRREADFGEHLRDLTFRSTHLQDGDLAAIASAAVSARGAVTVDSAVLWRAVKEINLLTHWTGLLRSIHTTEPMTEEAVQALYAQMRADLDGSEPDGGDRG